MKLWLDDVRDPVKHGAIGFVWARTAEEAIEYLKTGKVTFASLDHDLGVFASMEGSPLEISGYDVILWMEEHGFYPKDGVVIHSQNPVGRKRMEEGLHSLRRRLGIHPRD